MATRCEVLLVKALQPLRSTEINGSLVVKRLQTDDFLGRKHDHLGAEKAHMPSRAVSVDVVDSEQCGAALIPNGTFQFGAAPIEVELVSSDWLWHVLTA
jgi:hypothetical protein